MAHVKVLSPTELPLSDFLGPLPKGFSLEQQLILSSEANDSIVWARGQLRRELEESIRLAKPPNLTLVLPPGLIDTIADNVVLLAKDEPCGLRGSSLKVSLVEDYPQQETVLLRLKADSCTPTTHNLEVVLRPDPVSWYTKMAYIFRSFTKRRVVISPKFVTYNAMSICYLGLLFVAWNAKTMPPRRLISKKVIPVANQIRRLNL